MMGLAGRCAMARGAERSGVKDGHGAGARRMDHELDRAVPCPVCGYDLRGHAAVARCPECGRGVHAVASMAQASRWVDMRLLDLWSIGVLQMIGSVCAALSVLAIRHGAYVAVVLAMAGGMYVATASVWYIVSMPLVVVRMRRPAYRSIARVRRVRVWRWLIVDGGLVSLVPLLLALLWWW